MTLTETWGGTEARGVGRRRLSTAGARVYRGALPVGTQLTVGSGGTLDLGGVSQTVASLSDYLTSGNGGMIQSSGGAATLTLSATTGSTAVFSGAITGGVSLTMAGSGYQTLAGLNTYTGGTTITSGTLQVGNGTTSSGSLGSGNISIAGAGGLVFNGAPSGNVVVGGVISGAGGLTVSGGSVTLTANQNTFTGNVTVSGGTLLGTGQAQGTTGGSPLGNIGGGATVTVGNNATIILSANSNTTGYGEANINTKWVINGTLDFSGSGNDVLGNSLTLGGGTLISGGGNGFGDLVFDGFATSGSAAATISSTGAANSYIGYTANASAAGLAFGSFNLAASNTISVTGGGNLTIAVPLLNVNNNPGAANLAGLNAGPAASLTKTGSGLLVLTASNIYSGSTTISAGTLQLGNGAGTGTLPTGSTITDNATLVFDNSGTTTQGTQFAGAGITGSGGLVQAGRACWCLTPRTASAEGWSSTAAACRSATPMPWARARWRPTRGFLTWTDIT